MAEKLDAIAEFRDDHRKVRDFLLSLSEAVEAKDVLKAREILGNLDTFVGPHFRFEEECMYPMLREFLGEYIDQLISEHDGAIATAKACAELLQKDALTDEEAVGAKAAAMSLLIHVSNCDGLSILSERLSPEQLDEMGDKYAAAREAGVGMLAWADTIRGKSA